MWAVFTGYLGSGKTSIILGLIRELPADYKCVWLKNEFGDMQIDSEVAKQNNIAVRPHANPKRNAHSPRTGWRGRSLIRWRANPTNPTPYAAGGVIAASAYVRDGVCTPLDRGMVLRRRTACLHGVSSVEGGRVATPEAVILTPRNGVA
jgi:hypothetical protein